MGTPAPQFRVENSSMQLLKATADGVLLGAVTHRRVSCVYLALHH
jgi:hypothetical protein